MSTGLEGLSDDDAGDTPRPAGREIIDEGPPAAAEGDIDGTDDGGGSRGGLNPWSIAKLARQRQRCGSVLGAPVRELRRGTERPPGGAAFVAADGALVEMGQQTRPAESVDRRSRRRSSLGNAEQHTSERTTQRPAAFTAQSLRRQGELRGNRGFQSPPSSSPQGYDIDEVFHAERAQPQSSTSSGRLVQARISFDGDSRRQRRQNNGRAESQGEFPSSSTLNRHTRGSTARRRRDIDEIDEIIASVPIVESISGGRLEKEPARQFTSQDGVDAAVAADGGVCHSGQAPAHSSVAHDPRAQLIRQQCFKTQYPHRKLRRVKTEELPLETTPRGFQTFALLLTLAVDSSELTQGLSSASRYDTYLIDGKLRDGLDGETSPEDAAGLVRSSLGRTT